MTYVEILRAAIKEGKTNRIEAVRWHLMLGVLGEVIAPILS
jgi:hypothetical protein